MVTNGSKLCPDVETLRHFLDSDEGCVDETHIESCAHCQTRLEELTSGIELQSVFKSQNGLPDYLRRLPPVGLNFGRQVPPDSTKSTCTPYAPPGFELLEIVGCGGMGTVYRARQAALDREVAIKVISGGAHAGEERHHRFRQEAKHAAKLEHPNVVRIYGYDELDQLPFLIMEFVDGHSLTNFRGQSLSEETIVRLIQRLARALRAVHATGMVHRDVKPANILMAQAAPNKEGDAHVEINGENFIPKLTDFGLSKELLTDTVGSLSGGILGTPAYMAPEQAAEESEAIGPTTDVHALGIIMYELLVGSRPYDGNSTLDTLNAIRFESPQSLRHINPKIPPELEAICFKCLEKRPQDRYESAKQLDDELSRYLDNKQLRHTNVSRDGGRHFVGLGIALAFFLFACSGLILKIQTSKGKLIVKSDDANVKINVKRNEQSVASLLAKEMAGGFMVRCGDIQLSIEGAQADSYSLTPNRFVLKRKKDVIVRVIRKAKAQEIANKNFNRAHPSDAVHEKLASSAPALGCSQRDFAEWFVKNGGILRLEDHVGDFRRIETLPDGDLRITLVMDNNGFVTDEHLSLIADLPQLRMVLISSDHLTGENLSALNSVKKLRDLSLFGCPVNDQHFATFDNYENLSILTISGTQISSAFIPRLAKCKHLRDLDVTEQQILHPQGIEFLKSIDTLEQIGLYEFTDASAKIVRELPNLIRLRFDDGQGMSQVMMDAVCSCKKLQRLKFWRTDLSGIDFSGLQKLDDLIWMEVMNVNLSPDRVGEIADALPNCDLMHSLERDIASLVEQAGGTTEGHRTTRRKTKHPTRYHELQLDSVTFVDTPLLRDEHFLPYRHLKHLQSLTVNRAGINGSMLHHLSHLNSLEHLSLASTHVTDKQIGFLTNLTGLRSLNLQDTRVTAQGLKVIANLRFLESISLDGLQVTAETTSILSDLPKVRMLQLRRASDRTITQMATLSRIDQLSIVESYTVTDKSLDVLSSLGHLKALKLGGTNMTPSAVNRLIKSLPDCRIVELR